MAILIGLLILGIGLGLALGVFVGSRLLASRRAGAAAAENLRQSEEAKREAEAIRREARVEAREEVHAPRGGREGAAGPARGDQQDRAAHAARSEEEIDSQAAEQ